MIPVALLCLPIFGVVGLGWAAVRVGLASATIVDALATFSFRFALPALVFRLIARQPLARSFNPAFYGGYLGCGALVFAGAWAVARVFPGRGAAVAGAFATTAAVGNQGFLGPPLVLAFFGARGAGALAMAIMAEVMVLLSLGGALMAATPGAGAVRAAVCGTATNPVVLAIVLGAASAGFGVHPTPSLDRFLAFLGAGAGPTALFAVGGTLGRQRLGRQTLRAAVAISSAKLALYPLLVWIVLAPVLGLGAFWVRVGVLLAALPSAGSSYVFAQRYGADAESVSAAIALSTVLGVASVPLAAWLVGA